MIARRRESRLQQQLARTPLLASVGASDLRRLAAEGRERRYAEGDVVVYEGGAGGAFFIVGVWVLIAASLLSFFFPSAIGSLWISAATVLVFSGLLVFDTWRILRSGQYGPDDYVPAAVNIYLDLLNIFMAILNLLGGGRRR